MVKKQKADIKQRLEGEKVDRQVGEQPLGFKRLLDKSFGKTS